MKKKKIELDSVLPPITGKCWNCKKRKATIKWVGEGGILALSHGWYKGWCDYCATKAQLKYAKERAKEIPKLEKKLKRIK